MRRARKTIVNAPGEVLHAATRIAGKGVAATAIEGLAELRKRELRSALKQLQGKVGFDLALKATRR